MAKAQFVQAAGARLQFRVDGGGPAVLLIQGVGIVGEGWRPQVTGLRDRFSLISFDNRGIGGSTVDDGQVTVEAMAADALAVADAAGARRFHVVGHSLGGLIAQEVALRAGARVLSLALLCTFARGKDGVALSPAMLWLGVRTRIGTRAMRRRAFLELVMPGATPTAEEAARIAVELAPLFGHDLADQPPVAMAQLRAMARYDARARLGALTSTPTLVVSAERDLIARVPSGRALAAAIPGARFVEIEGAGHGVPIQSPDRINALLLEHFTRV